MPHLKIFHLKFLVVAHLVSGGICSGMQSCNTFAQSFVSCLFLDVVYLSCSSAGFSLVQVSWRVISDGICGQSWSGEMNYLMWLMHLMDLLINSTYNNTIAGKSQLRARDVFMYDKNGFWRRKWFLNTFFPYKMGYFPVTLAEFCVGLRFIKSFKIVGVSLKTNKQTEIMWESSWVLFLNAWLVIKEIKRIPVNFGRKWTQMWSTWMYQGEILVL